jgi:hypothetical protein
MLSNAPRPMFWTAFALPNAPRPAFVLPNALWPTFQTTFLFPNAPRPRLQAQEYYINYNYKFNSQEYIQSIIKYINSIHIVINVLELAFQSHEGVGTEDLYLTQTLSHGRRLWRVQSGPIWSCKGRQRALRVGHPCMGLFSFLSLLSTTREQVLV